MVARVLYPIDLMMNKEKITQLLSAIQILQSFGIDVSDLLDGKVKR